jgi:4-aminobutyrate aminotransferase/(S)-3-amino-2-methylpropionate transaminase
MDAPGVGGLGGTYGGNPVACAAALAALETYDALRLGDRANAIGRLFTERTHEWLSRFPLVGELRGLGAMQAIELVRDRRTREPAAAETARVLSACHERGLIVLSAGTYGNVLRLLVPLVVSDAQFQEGLDVLEAALQTVQSASR